MKTVAFLFPTLTGHLNPTISIAKTLEQFGFEVYYCGMPDLASFTNKNGVKHYSLNSIPFAMGMDGMIDGERKDKWLESLVDRFTDRIYKSRKKDIENLVKNLKPDIVFFDEFNFSDFMLLYPILENKRLIMLHCKFPQEYSKIVPPLNAFAFPSSNVEKYWRKYFLRRNWLRAIDFIKYFGRNDFSLIKQKFKALKIPVRFEINTKKVFKPTFKNLEEWFMVPAELDFEERILTPSQQYIGSMINTNRTENKEPIYESFIEAQQKAENSQLIYCSLGSVVEQHLKDKKGGIKVFVDKIIDIAFENPDLHIVFVLNQELRKKFKQKSNNLLFLDFAPQFDLLKRAAVFLTHGGNNSCVDAVLCETPMLLFPLNDIWDQNGTAARIVHKGMGVKADLNDSKASILSNISLIINDLSFYENIKLMNKTLTKKYNKKYLESFLATEFLVQ
jgi:zeaxanthin glucosyltransferase